MSERPDPDADPDPERVQESAVRRDHERTQHVESILDRADEMFGDHKYPVTSEEIATEYADQQLDLPNETESLGSVFDRLVDERFESADEVREVLYRELTGPAGPNDEYNEGRDLEELDEADPDDLAESAATDK